MKVGIMQPYFFPYIGYFQLIHAVDHFVFYDDVNFIKGGWINRNRILIKDIDAFITIPCKKISPNKLICETETALEKKNEEALLRTLEQGYKKAPFFPETFDIFESLIKQARDCKISEFNILSLKEISKHLSINTKFHISSEEFPEKNMGRTERIISITKSLGGNSYINALNGQALYSKKDFRENGLEILFLQPRQFSYKQFQNSFIPWLSIVDVMMFNPVEKIKEALNQYHLN